MVQVTDFDASEYLDNDEVVAEYLTAALEDPNPDVFLTAIGNVAAVRASSNWRVIFRFEGEDAVDVDYEDYH